MIFDKNPNNQVSLFPSKIFESKKLTWKDKFRRDLFRQNLKLIENAQTRKKKCIKDQQQKRATAKNLSKLFQKKTIYLQDVQQQFPNHGHYSSFIPLRQQVKLTDELRSTFPYIEHLSQKSHQQTKINVYNEISNHLGTSVEKNSVEIAWRSCLKKYMCDIDSLKAIEIYVEVLKRGTSIVGELHKKYGNGCSREVFFHRFCQSAKYFKQTNKINKNIKTSIELNDQISEVTLPKTSKCLFCPICLVYDCNQHNVDDTVSQVFFLSSSKFNFQYIARDNIVSKQVHIENILRLIRFQKQITSIPEEIQESKRDNHSNLPQLMEEQNGEIQMCYEACSSLCYKKLNKQTYSKKSSLRRPIISLIHRSLINMGIQIFSYDPCLLCVWIGNQSLKQTKQTNQFSRGISCENIFFYLVEEYELNKKLHYKLYRSEVDYLINESSRPENQTKINIMFPNKKKKSNPRFDHADNQNYRIGCCFHYFIGQEVFDHNCQRCCCKARGFCLPQCQCPQTCQIRKVGCSCKGKDDCRNKKCDCFLNNEECIPGLCKGCFDCDGINNKKNSCRNSMIQKQQTKYIRVGDSNICGLGAFAGEDIKKDDLVVIYSGEMIEHQIDYMREGLRLDQTFYNFGLNEGGAIDARFMGNKSRFINHQKGGQENLHSASVFSEGQFKTVLYAKKNIKKGEQLYFNYDVGGQISTNFPGKYDFIKKSKK